VLPGHLLDGLQACRWFHFWRICSDNFSITVSRVPPFRHRALADISISLCPHTEWHAGQHAVAAFDGARAVLRVEQGHADQIAARIVQLGGAPNLSPEGMLGRSHSEYIEGGSLVDMIRENLVAERIAIDNYREMIQYLGNEDPTTRRLLEEILAVEEEHAEDMTPGRRAQFAEAGFSEGTSAEFNPNWLCSMKR